ncbi:MAG: hypothetical protein IPO91_23330 [Chloroflexi bacterium]|nr:hypothetical protein [Chloroflexota bacterium]
MRDFINEDVRRHKPSRYQELHQKAATYFSSQLNQPSNSLDHTRATVELIYHQVRANEEKGLRFAADIFNDAADLFQATTCEMIYQAVKGSLLNESNQPWVEYFAGVTAKLQVSSLEAERILRTVLDKPASHLDPELRVYAGRWLAGSLWFAGKFHDVIKYARETRELSAELGVKGIKGMKEYEHRALETLGLALDRLGQFDEGIEVMLELESSSKSVGDRRGEGWGLLSAGYFSWHSGDWDNAELYLSKCLRIARDIKSDYMEVYPLGHLGLLYVGLGIHDKTYLERARQYLDECKQKALPATSREMDCKSHQNLAQLNLTLGNLEEAEKFAQKATQLATGMFHPYYEADALRIWGQILIERGMLQEAAAKLIESSSIAERIDGKYVSARSQVQLYRIQALDTGAAMDTEVRKKYAFENVLDYMKAYKFHGLRSDLYLWRAYSVLDSDLGAAKQYIANACYEGLLFNRFSCDRALNFTRTTIIPLLKNHEDVQDILKYLMDFTTNGRHLSESLISFESNQRTKGHIEAARVSMLTQIQSMLSEVSVKTST